MKKIDDPYYHIAPRAMKYEEDIEQELLEVSQGVSGLDKEEQVKYLMKATRGHYSPELIREFLEKKMLLSSKG